MRCSDLIDDVFAEVDCMTSPVISSAPTSVSIAVTAAM